MPYYEDLAEPRPGGKLYGYRRVEELPTGRTAGYNGMEPITLTEPVALLKGCKQIILKASKEKPVEVWSSFNSVDV